MDKFMLCPQLSGYSFLYGQNILEQSLTAGMPRQRLNFIGAVHQVTVSVFCTNADEIDYFWAFWRIKQRNPENWLWSLKTDSSKLEEHECRFMMGSLPQESDRQGDMVKYSFSLWVKPLNRPPSVDEDIIGAWQAGLNPNVMNRFEILANKAAADALEPFL